MCILFFSGLCTMVLEMYEFGIATTSIVLSTVIQLTYIIYTNNQPSCGYLLR